jgi:hypothetical protein
MSIDVSELVAAGCDPTIVVASSEECGCWPHDRHHRLISAIAGIFGQKDVEVKAAQVATKKVMMHPMDATTRKRDTAQ